MTVGIDYIRGVYHTDWNAIGKYQLTIYSIPLLKLHQHIYYFTVWNSLISSSLLKCGLFSVRRSFRRHLQDVAWHTHQISSVKPNRAGQSNRSSQEVYRSNSVLIVLSEMSLPLMMTQISPYLFTFRLFRCHWKPSTAISGQYWVYRFILSDWKAIWEISFLS